jgi:cell division septum initiation protein DivIVA
MSWLVEMADPNGFPSPEEEALQRFLVKLAKACMAELELLVLHLYSQRLISEVVKIEATTYPPPGVSRLALTDRVLTDVKSKITPERMDTFIDLIRAEFPPLTETADDLKKCVKELREQAQQKANHHSLRPARLSSLQQGSGSFSNLEVEFACLQADLIDCLEGDPKALSMMRNALRNWDEKPEFRHIEPGSLENAKTVEEFFVALKPHYLDCTLLYIAIRAQKNSAAKEKMAEYLEMKQEADVLLREKDELSPDQTSNGGENSQLIAGAVIQKEGMSGREYEETTSWLSYLWGVPRAALNFLRGKKGSVIIEWQIDASLEPLIRAGAITGLALRVLSKLNVTEIKLGDSYRLEIPQLMHEAEDSRYSSEALFSAVRAGDCEMMERLLRGGAPMNAQDEEGSTALFVACDEVCTDAVQMLLEKGANPNIAKHVSIECRLVHL